MMSLLKGNTNLDEKYFSEIRPKLYENHAKHNQYGVRKGTSLAEHLDSACQFVLTVSKIAKIPDHQRQLILAATSVHDLNKLDDQGRNVKKLARDPEFLQEQLEKACVSQLVKTEEDYELVRRLIERHSGHSASDGMRFLPEDENIEKWAAMLIGADLFDLGIDQETKIRKIENELTVALGYSVHIFQISISEDRGYLTSLLLSACEEVLIKYNLTPLAILTDGEMFIGKAFPEHDLTKEIAQAWQIKINRVFAGNIEQLVQPTTSGIKVDPKAINQDLEESLIQVQALLEKKKASYKTDKVAQDIAKHGGKAGQEAIELAENLGLTPVSNADEFAISEGLKAVYVSYGQTGLKAKEIWDKIGNFLELTTEQREAIEPFDALYGRCLFTVKAVKNGRKQILEMLRDSFEIRKKNNSEKTEVSQEMILAVSRMLNLPQQRNWQGITELNNYINANPRQRCSLGTTSEQIEELISNKMPPETKVQSFSNRLPGGMNAEPKRKADSIAALAYQLLAVGANFPKATKQEPLYLHFSLPQGSSPELLRIWRNFLKETASTNAEGGTVTIDELQLYRDNILEFKENKVVGFAFPKRPDFIHLTVIIPVLWGDVNASVALLKSLRLALEISLATDFGFPFVLTGNLEIETSRNFYARVEGIPSSLQPLLNRGEYKRFGHQLKSELNLNETAEEILKRLRCLGQIVVTIASPQKRDDCLYDLACTAKRPLDFYHVILRWLLREHDDPNFEYFWDKIKQPLNLLLESLMPNEHDKLTTYLKEAAHLAEVAKLRGSSFRRTAQSEPFSAFISAIRSRKSHLPWEVVFASLVQEYHTRLDRIREHGVGATKYEQVKQYYDILQKIFEEIYQSRPEKLLADKKTLEAAYLFFLQEARQQLKAEKETEK